MKTAETRLTETVREHLFNDAMYHHFMPITQELCKMARSRQWTKSEHWSVYQSVVFHLEDLMKDWVEKETDGSYSLTQSIVMTARAYVDYKELAKEFVYAAIEIIDHVDDPDNITYYDSEDYLGPWDFQEWLVGEAAKAYDHYTEDELEESIQ